MVLFAEFLFLKKFLSTDYHLCEMITEDCDIEEIQKKYANYYNVRVVRYNDKCRIVHLEKFNNTFTLYTN